MPTRTALLTRTRTLCQNFSTSAPLPTLLSNFTHEPPPTALEHGLPQLAPFLGRPFTGQEGIQRYFGLLAELLTIEKMEFEPEEKWVVDERAMAVSLRGEGRFRWNETGQAWDETFAYRIGLVKEEEEDGEVKVVDYEVWADTGAAYLARVGGLIS
ncbi:hypothetical protein ANOM_004472 [Aspergillus nomiae NRRL 13137]|uniref:SnoaL-like domain-containing protein n=1 Tax=Aspergillus nomiae NRRL (strain ATCC 15546 / NRRL 13137 / CBS 260.88 / M93) TaxID=1509407 RepID=A0A0L1J7F1_ASPN3|nr:uncharacterized protein ANOM_004472 [Aspergillus nomiae NRRL 13137]KNG87741.1 hypothetical protein ANOM_004472 [Aspergillus nomiae NRRL 13137]